MKRSTWVKASFVMFILTLVSCSDHLTEQQCYPAESHDQNVFMQINHRMMDDMMAMQMTNDPDQDFAMMMRRHHQAAIEMANVELGQGTNAQMKAIAQNVIDAQTKEVAMLTQFLQSHNPEPLSTGPTFNMESMMAMDKQMQANDIRVLTTNADVTFAQLLIDHHQAAIENAQSLLKYGDDATIRNMASNIIESQMKEIMELQNWLKVNRNY